MESLRKKEQHVVKNSPNEGQAQFTSVTADNVPRDWIVGKTEEGEQRIVGPDGSRHKTRREALKHMVSKACPEEEIALMRSCLKAEGWEDHENLPPNWKHKTKTDKHGTRNYIMSSCGKMFDNIAKAVTYMQNSLKFRSSEIEKVHSMASMEKAIRPARPTPVPAQPNISWTEDATVPVGWKVGPPEGGRQRVLCPDGTKHGSRREVLKYMVAKSCHPEEINWMRSCLKAKGWEDNENLPPNWKFMTKESSQGPKKLIMSDDGNLFPTITGAVQFMERAGTYTRESMENVKKLSEWHQMGRGGSFFNSAAAGACTWISEDPSVPQGWKVAAKTENEKERQSLIMSPEQKIFQSRRQAMKYLMDNSASSHKIDEMRDCLNAEGWQDHLSLPVNWKMKVVRNAKVKNSKKKIIMSSSGKVYETIIAAVRYMESSKKFTGVNLQMLKQLQQGVAALWYPDLATSLTSLSGETRTSMRTQFPGDGGQDSPRRGDRGCCVLMAPSMPTGGKPSSTWSLRAFQRRRLDR